MNYIRLLILTMIVTGCGDKTNSNDTSSNESAQNFQGGAIRTVYYSKSDCVLGFTNVGNYWSSGQKHNTCLQDK
jgi:uncharacterized lipoprotein YehR (DUF1307 family)